MKNLLFFVLIVTALYACKKNKMISSNSQNMVHPIKTEYAEMILVKGGKYKLAGKIEVQIPDLVADKFEVNQAMYTVLEIPNPSHFQDPKRPVEQVRWTDAAEVCNDRSELEGLEPCYDVNNNYKCDYSKNGYRLPTEAEWEYLARCGAEGTVDIKSSELKKEACLKNNSNKKTSPTGSFRANDWGFHDMLGNVSEWCNDYYHKELGNGNTPSDKKVLRGASWKDEKAGYFLRFGSSPGITDACFAVDNYGFRCVRKPNATELAKLKTAQ